MSLHGTSRHLVAPYRSGRFRGEADINRQANPPRRSKMTQSGHPPSLTWFCSNGYDGPSALGVGNEAARIHRLSWRRGGMAAHGARTSKGLRCRRPGDRSTGREPGELCGFARRAAGARIRGGTKPPHRLPLGRRSWRAFPRTRRGSGAQPRRPDRDPRNPGGAGREGRHHDYSHRHGRHW